MLLADYSAGDCLPLSVSEGDGPSVDDLRLSFMHDHLLSPASCSALGFAYCEIALEGGISCPCAVLVETVLCLAVELDFFYGEAVR